MMGRRWASFYPTILFHWGVPISHFQVPILRGVPLPVWTNRDCDAAYFQVPVMRSESGKYNFLKLVPSPADHWGLLVCWLCWRWKGRLSGRFPLCYLGTSPYKPYFSPKTPCHPSIILRMFFFVVFLSSLCHLFGAYSSEKENAAASTCLYVVLFNSMNLFWWL